MAEMRIPQNGAPGATIIRISLHAQHECCDFVGAVFSSLAFDAVADIFTGEFRRIPWKCIATAGCDSRDAGRLDSRSNETDSRGV